MTGLNRITYVYTSNQIMCEHYRCLGTLGDTHTDLLFCVHVEHAVESLGHHQ